MVSHGVADCGNRWRFSLYYMQLDAQAKQRYVKSLICCLESLLFHFVDVGTYSKIAGTYAGERGSSLIAPLLKYAEQIHV